MSSSVHYESVRDGILRVTRHFTPEGLLDREVVERITYDEYLDASSRINMNAEPKGDWIQTYTGKRFYILDPRTEDVCIEDIAHSLSLQCRYLGHAKFHYSIAQHCVLLVAAAWRRGYSAEECFRLLMHDAGEAYYGDWPRPIKNSIPGIQEAMDAVDKVIQEKYNIPPDEDWLKTLDSNIVVDEKKALMAEKNGWVYIGKEPFGADIKKMEPEQAEVMFLTWASFLCRETGRRYQ